MLILYYYSSKNATFLQILFSEMYERKEMVKRYLNCRIPCGVRQVFRIKEIITRHLNPRTPYGVRRTRERCEGDNGNLNPRTPYGVRLSKKEIRMFSNHLNPRTPYGVRQQFCIKNIAFLYRLHLFFWTNCLSEKNIIVFSKGFFFLSSANLPGFSCSLPIRTT